MTVEKRQFEDVSPLENGDVPGIAMLVFGGVGSTKRGLRKDHSLQQQDHLKSPLTRIFVQVRHW